MTVALGVHADERLVPLDLAVLELLHQRVLAGSERDPVTGCLLGPGRIRWAGGWFAAKRVEYEHAHGPLADSAMVVRRCGSSDCSESTHHVAETRKEFGARLGSGAGWRRQATA